MQWACVGGCPRHTAVTDFGYGRSPIGAAIGAALNYHIYKYVSNRSWNPRDAQGGLAAGDKYLDDGRLYVAQFLPDGSGQWVELRFGINGITSNNPTYPFVNQADVLINARLAADAAGATKMDRPEWGAVHPKNGEVYFTLTNNAAAQRPITAVDAANPRFYNDKRTTGTDQKGNPNGHIIRFVEDGRFADALSSPGMYSCSVHAQARIRRTSTFQASPTQTISRARMAFGSAVPIRPAVDPNG